MLVPLKRLVVPHGNIDMIKSVENLEIWVE